jgi:glyoxylase-like metal-dependent hydrolase (beta-lactamase superfamily II)
LALAFSGGEASAQGPTPARQKSQAKSVSEKSYEKARQVLDAGLVALGGVEAIRAAEDVSIKGKGVAYARNQSVGVLPPFDAMPHDESLFVNTGRQRFVFENRDPLPGGFVFGGKVVISGGQGFFVNPRDRTVAPLNPANLPAVTLNYVRRLPHLLLMAARDRAQTLRWLGEAEFEGRRHNALAFATSNGVLMTLFFDARTNLLSKYEQMVSDPQTGDAVQETIFPGYQTVGGIKLPSGRITKRGGEVLEDVEHTDAFVNTRPAESAFAKPEGFAELPAPAPPPTRETKLADGVYLFESGANSLVVEFADHVLVVEPYAGGRGPKPTINKIKEMMPGKPVKYIVVTHHHDDHSGGLRSYIAEGARVVTTPANQNYFERMAAGTFTIARDDQTSAARKPVFDFVTRGKHVFTDGEQIVEVMNIGPSPHAREMLIVYLPKEKLVFQGDLVNLPADGKYAPSTVNDTTVHFYDTVKRMNLDVKRIAAVHGPPTTLEDLREAVEKKRAAK